MQKKWFIFPLIAAVFLDTLGMGIVTPLLPIYAEELLDDKASLGMLVGLLFATHSLMRIVAMPLFGYLSDRLGKRKVFILSGLIIFMLASVGYALAESYADLLLMRLLQGVGSTMFYPIVLSYVAEMSPDGKEGGYVGPVNSAAFIGMGTGPILGGFLTDLFHYHWVFFGMGFMSLGAFVLILFMVPDSPVAQKRKVGRADLKAAFANRIIGGVMLYRFLNAFLRGGQMSFMPLLATAFYGLSFKEIGIVFACKTFLVGVLQSPFERLADRWPKVPLIVFGNLIAALALILLPVAGGFWGMLPLSALIGIGSAIAIASAVAITVQQGKKNKLMSSTMGLFGFSMSVGMLASPLFSGTVHDSAGLFWVFPACGGLVIVGTGVVAWLLGSQKSLSARAPEPAPVGGPEIVAEPVTTEFAEGQRAR